MRRVIDDTYYEEAARDIMRIVRNIKPEQVSEYSYGTYRAKSRLIIQQIKDKVEDIKFGKSLNTTGIGNNEQYEIIYTGNPQEEQICGAIHLTDDMYGSVIVWVSDIDNTTKTQSIKIHGTEPRK